MIDPHNNHFRRAAFSLREGQGVDVGDEDEIWADLVLLSAGERPEILLTVGDMSLTLQLRPVEGRSTRATITVGVEDQNLTMERTDDASE